MLPTLLSHNQYLQFVSEQLKTSQGPKAHQQVPEKLALLELTPIRLLVLDTDAGRPAFAPEAMLRTFMAMLFCGISAWTKLNLYCSPQCFGHESVPSGVFVVW